METLPLVKNEKGGPGEASLRPQGDGAAATADVTSDRPPTAHVHHSRFWVICLTLFASLGGFLFGYDTGVVSGAMIVLRDVWHLTPFWQELIISVTLGAAAVSCPFGGILNDKIGRKPTILLSSVLFVVGAVLLGAAWARYDLILGRVILGVAIGISSSTVPMYLAEMASAEYRGSMVFFYQVGITFGIFMSGVVNAAFSYVDTIGWRYMFGVSAVPAVFQLVGFLFMPESPRYLLSKNNTEKATLVLQQVRGTSDVQAELDVIKEAIEVDKRSATEKLVILRVLHDPPVRRALFIGCTLSLVQQLCGINTVLYYSASIMRMAGVHSTSQAIWMAALVASVNFFFTFAGLYLVDRIGRRMLSIGSLTGVFLSLMMLSVSFRLLETSTPPVTVFDDYPENSTAIVDDLCSNHTTCSSCIKAEICGFCFEEFNSWPVNGSCVPAYHDMYGFSNMSVYGRCSDESILNPDFRDAVWAYSFCPTNMAWLTMFAMITYLASFSQGMGPIPWTVNSEIYPLWARSTCNAISAMVNWSANLLASMTFLTLAHELTTAGAFGLYCGLTALGVVFVFFFLPETRGKSLEQVQSLFEKPLF